MDEKLIAALEKCRAATCELCKCSTWGISWCANEGCPSGYEPYEKSQQRPLGFGQPDIRITVYEP